MKRLLNRRTYISAAVALFAAAVIFVPPAPQARPTEPPPPTGSTAKYITHGLFKIPDGLPNPMLKVPPQVTDIPKPPNPHPPAPVAVAPPPTPAPAPRPVAPKPAPAPAPKPAARNIGDYPAELANAPRKSILDQWYMYNRECVSYTAYKVSKHYGYSVYGWGSANAWENAARARGLVVSTVPKPGAVGVTAAGRHGHTVWVEAVRGGYITASQYNGAGDGTYSVQNQPTSNYRYIYFN